MQNNIDIIIINWNGGYLLKQCVTSVLQSSYKNYKIHIIDNGSVDSSCEMLPQSEKIKTYFLKKNYGFGKACNIALEFCKGEYLLLLNPDTTIEHDTLSRAIDHFARNTTGVYGVAQKDDNGNILRSCGRFPNFLTFCNDVLGFYRINDNFFINGFIQHEWDHSESKFVPHVMGSFYLVDRKIIDKIGFMDDRYFVYMEDLDLSLRISQAGYKIFYDRSNVIYHKGGGVSEHVKASRLFYALHAKHEFTKKHFSPINYVLSSMVLIFVSPFARILFALFVKRSLLEVKETYNGYKLFYLNLFTGKI
jgi:GT2 family glycosyltransferase